MPVSIGEVLEGQVVKLLKYGAIVELEGGQTGLVHISEIADEFVKDVSGYLREGDKVKVKVMAFKEPGRLELSIRKAGPGGPSGEAAPEPRKKSRDEDFEKRLTDFMKRSNQLQNERKRAQEARRRGG